MKPFSLLIKPAGPDCNLDCRYCFYTPKSCLFTKGKHRMSPELLEKIIADIMKLNFPVTNFAWQGGEPTLMGLDFYEKVIKLQQQFGQSGQSVSNSLQTNAILLDDNWCKFLQKYKWLVGISLDGPKHLHDHYRKDKAGKPTFDKVITAIKTARKYNTQFNVLVLLNDQNVTKPDELFDFFTELKIKYLQFVPCIEKNPATGRITDFSVTPKQFADFLCTTFDRWIDFGPENLSIRILDSIMSFYLNQRHTNCSFANKCDDYIVIEHNGDAFCCDFFVEQQYKIGNVLETNIEKLIQSDIKRNFAKAKSKIHNNCLICTHSQICRGGCLKDRLVLNNNLSDTSYFCQSYKQFFDYALPKLPQIAAKFANRDIPTNLYDNNQQILNIKAKK
ncbi:MAG: anaerobic sulfatase maturase [Planctomycetes bacterium]|nr:anaerobic sulfatase maturase [Planctomycetota bacterium]